MRIEFNIAPIVARLSDASRILSDLTPMHRDIGEYLVEATKKRFLTSTAPDGTKWQPKSAATVARYKAKGKGSATRPLIGMSRRLGREIVNFATAAEAEVGSALEYSAVMQEGAEKGAFGTNAKGRPIPWGRIPARVWLGISDADERNILDIVEERFLGPAIDSDRG